MNNQFSLHNEKIDCIAGQKVDEKQTNKQTKHASKQIRSTIKK